MTAERLFFVGNFAGMTALWLTSVFPLATVAALAFWWWSGYQVTKRYRLVER